MRIVTAEAPARVALAGNPSDGFGGGTLALAISEFTARATVYEWPRLEIVPAPQDGVSFAGLGDLDRDVAANGYYGGLRLVKAALRRLTVKQREAGEPIDELCFSIRWETGIPRGVGLGGSSAIVIATLRAVCEYAGIEIDPRGLAELALSVETDELGIAAGLQDRVAQAYGGLTYMDFSSEPNRYEPIDPSGLPPLFLAQLTGAAQPSDVFHSGLRRRVAAGDGLIADLMESLAGSAARAAEAARHSDHDGLRAELATTLGLRKQLAPLEPAHLRLAEIAAEVTGSAANFTGSGGAVVGVADDEDQMRRLAEAYENGGGTLLRATPAPGSIRSAQ